MVNRYSTQNLPFVDKKTPPAASKGGHKKKKKKFVVSSLKESSSFRSAWVQSLTTDSSSDYGTSPTVKMGHHWIPLLQAEFKLATATDTSLWGEYKTL